MIFLDTDFLIEAVVPGSPEDVQVERWLLAGEILAVSAVAWTEFLNGPVDAVQIHRGRSLITAGIEDFTELQAVEASRLFNATGRRRRHKFDCLVAAAAITSDARLATRNTADFQFFVPYGLQLAT